MTLCIGKATNQQVMILGDTRISDPRLGTRRSLTTGCVKTTILARNVALSFSGDPTIAQRDLSEFKERYGADAPYQEVITFFLEATTRSRNSYMIALSDSKRIIKLDEGTKTTGKSAWIGDKGGFERFQKGVTPHPNRTDNRILACGPDVIEFEYFSDQIYRLFEVIEDPEVLSVGDFMSVAVGTSDGFRFCFVGSLYFDSEESPILGPRGEQLLATTGENRGYSYAVWISEDMTSSDLIFNFPDARKAFLFHSPTGGFADCCVPLLDLEEGQLKDEAERIAGHRFHDFKLFHA